MEYGEALEEYVKIAELNRKIGQILVERGDYEQAMNQFRLGLQYLEGMEHTEVARIYNEIGRVYWSQGQLDEAQHWTEKAFELADRLFDPEELARLHHFAGIRYSRQGENRLAKEHWLKSLQISQDIGDVQAQAQVYQNLGLQSKRMGQYQQALEYLEKGRALAYEGNNTSSLSYIHETIGEIYYALGKWQEAIENLQQSLKFAEQAMLPKATSRSLSTLGDIYRRQGRLAEADECYQRSLASIASAGASQSSFLVNLGLGLINMDRQKYDEAEEILNKCWNIASEGVGFTSRMATIKVYLSELMIKMGRLEEAVEHCTQAIDLATRAEAQPELAHAALVEGLIAAQQADWEKAIERYNHALAEFEKLGDKYNQGRACLELGMAYRAKSDSEEDNTQSRAYLEKARAIFSELGAQAQLDKFPVDD